VVAFTLLNKTDNPIKVDWNQVSFVDDSGSAHKVIHQGIRLIQRDEPMVATTVPPGAKVSDYMYPSDLVLRLGGDWVTPPLLPKGERAAAMRGKKLSVFLPLEINGAAKNYSFESVIKDVQPK
jgi:hypothetical protein